MYSAVSEARRIAGGRIASAIEEIKNLRMDI
jgi:hypothetical protein